MDKGDVTLAHMKEGDVTLANTKEDDVYSRTQTQDWAELMNPLFLTPNSSSNLPLVLS